MASSSGGPARRRPGWGSGKIVIWVPSFSRARRCFPIFLGRLLGRRARVCSSLSFLGWPSILLFSGGSAQHALGRPLDRLSAAGSRVSRGQRASCMSAELGGANFLSSFSCMLVVSRANHPFQHVFPLFPTATRKCVCVGPGASFSETPFSRPWT